MVGFWVYAVGFRILKGTYTRGSLYIYIYGAMENIGKKAIRAYWGLHWDIILYYSILVVVLGYHTYWFLVGNKESYIIRGSYRDWIPLFPAKNQQV